MYGKRTDTCAAAAGFILTICQSMMQKVEDSFYRGVIGEDTELNKIYKVVWSRSKGCYVVASEFAKRHVGKVRSGSIAGRTTLLGLLVVHTLAAAPAYAVTGSGASSGFGSGPSGVSYTSTQPEGQNGLAIGVSGSTYAYGNANTVAIGTSSVAYGKSSVAIGGAVTGTGYNGQIALGWTRTNGEGAVAIGGAGTTGATGTGAVAIGGNSSIANGTDAVALGDSGASGNRSVALGGSSATGANTFAASGAVVNGAGSIAIGQTANVTAVNSSAIGVNNQADSTGAVISGVNVLGNNNKVNASGAGVIGNNNTVAAQNTDVFILGNGVTATTSNSVFLGTGSAYIADGSGSPSKGINKTYTGDTLNGRSFSFAGGNIVTGVVSVGSLTGTRRIQGVAPGLLSAGSTDAVNGSQLYAVANSLTATMNGGLNFQGDDLTPVNKQLGDTLTVKGGTTANLTDGNIGVVSDASGALNVKLKKDIDLGSTGSIVTGASKLNTNGLAVDGKTYVAATGLNANNAKISNVSAGTLDTDAVNVQQMRAELAADKTYMANGTNTTISGDGSSASPFAVNLNNKITLGDKTNAPDKAITIDGTTGVITAGNKVTVNGVTGNITAGAVQIAGSGTVNGLTNLAWDIDSPTVVSGQAATEDQLKTVSDGVKTNTANLTTLTNAVGSGLSFGGDAGAAITKQLGERMDITGGATTDLTDNNIGVISDGTALHVKLAKTLTGLDSVTAGGTAINSTGLTVGGKTYVTAAGLDGNSQVITNVASGGNTTTNAANIGDVARIAAGNDKYVTGGAVSYGTDGKGSATLAGANGLTATMTGLQDTYITGAATAADGKTATLTRNDNQTFTLDLTNTIKAAADQAAATEQTTTLSNGSNTTVAGVTTGNNTEYKVNVNTDGTTLTTTGNSLSAVTTALTAGGTGTVAATAGNALVTGSAVANAINSAGWQLAGPDGSKKLITAGSTVNFRNGKGSTANVANVSGEYAVSYDVNVDGSTIKIGDDGKLTVNTSAVDTDTVTTIASSDQTVKVTKGANDENGNTTYDVAVNTGKTLKKDGATGAIDVNTGNGLTVGSDGTINVATTTLTTTGGKASAGTADSYATAGSVAEAINSASFNVTAGTNSTGAVTTAVKAGETVTFNAGSNLNVTQAGSQFTYGLNSNLTGIASLANTKTDNATGTTTGTTLTLSDAANQVDLGGAQVMNMASGGTTVTNGATIGDVKSAVAAAANAATTNGLNFTGNDGVSVHRDLGSTLAVRGGLTDVTAGVSNKNLGVKKNSAGDGLELVMSENPAFETVTAGTELTKQVTIGDAGVTVGGKAYITNAGINANSQKITNVADGTATTDAVNYGQLAAVKITVAGGLKFSGDVSADTALANTFKRSLGQETKIVGGVTDTALLSDGNIGIVSNGVDTLTVKLAKDLQGLASVRTGNTLMDTNGIAVSNSAADPTKRVTLTNAGLDNGGNKIVNVADGLVETGSKEAINGGQLQGVIDGITDAAKGGFGFFDDKGTKVQQDLGKQVTFKGVDGVTVSGDNEYKTMTIGLSRNVSVGTKGADGADGKISVSGKNGAGIVLNGADGSIALNGANGADAVSIKSGQGAPAVDGTDGATKTRLSYTDGTVVSDVATLDDGIKYGGDYGTTVKKKLNEQVNVVGGVSDTSLLTAENNLGVVSDGVNNLQVRLAKNLKGLNSIDLEDEFGNYTAVTTTGYEVGDDTGSVNIGAHGIFIMPSQADSNSVVSLTDAGLNNGGNKITNVAAGEADTDAVNMGQLRKFTDGTGTGATGGFGLQDDAGKAVKQNLGEQIRVKGDGNITTEADDSGKTLTVKLADNVTFGAGGDPSGQVAVDGTAGIVKAGTVTVDGKQGTVDGLTNTVWDAAHDYSGSGKAATEAQLQQASQAIQNSLKAAKVTVSAGKNITVTKTTAADGSIDYQAATADDLTAKSFNAADGNGNTANLSGSGLTVTAKDGKTSALTAAALQVNGSTYITQDGINGNNKVITNVADGKVAEGSTNAVNGGQLYVRDVAIEKQGEAINKIANAIGNLNDGIADVGANAAALSALKPMAYDPLEPTQIMAGFGGYKGAHAVAIGIAHYQSDAMMLQAGMSLGTHDNMYNAGITWKIGSRSGGNAAVDRNRMVTGNAVSVMQKEMTVMKAQNDKLLSENKAQRDKIDAQQEEIDTMKAQIQALMAKVGM